MQYGVRVDLVHDQLLRRCCYSLTVLSCASKHYLAQVVSIWKLLLDHLFSARFQSRIATGKCDMCFACLFTIRRMMLAFLACIHRVRGAVCAFGKCAVGHYYLVYRSAETRCLHMSVEWDAMYAMTFTPILSDSISSDWGEFFFCLHAPARWGALFTLMHPRHGIRCGSSNA